MKYLGLCIPKSSYFAASVGIWYDIPARTVCQAETPEEQMQCSSYEAATLKERLKYCHTAPDFSCRFCECGCSDLCGIAGNRQPGE